MSYSTLKRKLQPASKALKSVAKSVKELKSVAKSVKSKLHSFSLTKTLNVIKTNSHRLLSYCSLHLPRRRCSLRRRPSRHPYNSHLYPCYYRNNKDQYYKSLNFSPIYLDQFNSVAASPSPALVREKGLPCLPESSGGGSNSKRKGIGDRIATEEKGKEKILNSIEDAWREVVAKSPQLRPVDDRAEEFIFNFRQEMRLQKEKSIVDFEEMLVRGT